MANLQTWFTTFLALPLSVGATTATLWTVPTATQGRLHLYDWSQEEWVSYTGVSGVTVTGLTRNLSQTADPATGGTWLTWIAGTPVDFVAMHDQIVDKTGSNTFATGTIQTFPDIDFTGTTTWGIRVKNLTTAQRDAIASPLAGQIIYNTTTLVMNQYIAWAWTDFSTGTTAAASTTVAGKVEIATQAETEAMTATGGTGAILTPTAATLNPSAITTATPAVGDLLSFADISASNVYKSATLQTLVDTARPLATNSEASTWSWTTQSVTPLQLKKYFWPEPSAGTTYTAAIVSGSAWTTTSTSYVQMKIGTIARTWTYSTSFYISAWWWHTTYGRIYKNGVAFGTERSVTSTNGTFTEDLAFTAADTISFRMKVSSGTGTMTDPFVKYGLVDQNAFTLA